MITDMVSAIDHQMTVLLGTGRVDRGYTPYSMDKRDGSYRMYF